MARDLRLLITILRACAGADVDDRELASILARASALEWQRTVSVLASHRLEATTYAALGDSIDRHAPERAAASLRSASRDAFLLGTMQLQELERALAALDEAGVAPIVLKGAALIDAIYGSAGARPMLDVDLLLEPGSEERAAAAFQGLGWNLRRTESDAREWETPNGLRFDVLHRFRHFERWRFAELIEQRAPRLLRRANVAMLEPNAQLVHLVVHMNGHRSATGHLLAWYVDVARLLRARGGDLDADRLRRLADGAMAFAWLWRTIDFLERELGVPAPEGLRERPPDLPPLTLDEILRSRRLEGAAPWSARALRRVARRTLARPFDERLPTLSDAVASLADRTHESGARHVAARWLDSQGPTTPAKPDAKEIRTRS